MLTFPTAEQVTPQITPQVQKLLKVLTGEQDRSKLQEELGLSDREHFRKNYLQPAIEQEVIELTIPDKPKSSKQRYRLTMKGQKLAKKARKMKYNVK